jgi:predicted nucleotidyltransferase component of viral defense system
VRYGTADAFRAALDQRLKNEAATGPVALIRLRKRVAFERFLARLVTADPDSWMLTGAFALDLRLGLGTRATKDIDLARADDEHAATEHLIAASALDLDDFFDFDVRRTGLLGADAGFHAVRYSIRADLAGRRFEQFPVDVALGAPSQDHPQLLPAPDLLAFAEIDAPDLPVVSLERQVAEKLHAYTATYGSQRLASTRVKDLIDLVLIGELGLLDARRLGATLESTFDARATHPLPSAVPPPPRFWARPYAELAKAVGIPPDLDEGHTAAARLLDPILASGTTGRWERGAKASHRTEGRASTA